MNRFKDLRKASGLTQEELGKILNVQKATISRYEKGLIFPSPEVLKQMAATFNVSTDYLLGNDTAKRPTSLSSEQKKILTDFASLTVDGQNMILGMLNSLKVTHAVSR